MIVGTPKSDAVIRPVAIPPHLLPALEAHLAVHVAGDLDALLFRARSGCPRTTSCAASGTA